MKNSLKLLAVIFLITIFSCNKSGLKLPENSFSRYISGFTYGVISIKSTFQIELQDNYKGSEKVGDEIKTKLFDFSPSIEGRTILKSPNKIEFIPSAPLKKDKTYDIKFNLKEAINEVDDNHHSFEYSVKTIKESGYFINEGLVVNQNSGEKVFDFKGKIISSDFTDNKTIEEKTSINSSNKIVWNHSADGIEHSFTIKSIPAQNSAQNLKLEIEDVTNSSEDFDIYIPSKEEFVVSSVTIDNNDKNKITICFSENLSKTANEGMCSINGMFNYTMQIESNKMILTPNDEKLYGDITVKALAGLHSVSGKKLAKNYEKTLSFGNRSPKAEIIGEGSILVNNDGAKLPIKTVGLNQVRVEIYKIYQSNVLFFLQNNSLNETYDTKRFAKKIHSEVLKLNGKSGFAPYKSYNYNLDLSNIVNLEKGAIYQVRLSFDKSMAAINCGESKKETGLFNFSMLNSTKFEEEENTDEEENSYEYYYPENFDYSKKDDPCSESYYNYERFSKKNILVSNIGLIAKKGTNNKIYATCVDLLTAEPMLGALIEVFDYQFQNVGKNSTNMDGFCEISSKEKPYFVVATKNGQKNYLKLEKSNSQAVDVFDVEGNASQNGLKGFVYGERGVWRPGDKMHLTMILSNGFNELPADLPCQMELINPLGQVFDKQINDRPLHGFYAFQTKTSPDAVTGNWIARFKVGGLKYDKIVKVETVKPNRLRIVPENNEEFIVNGQKIKYQTSWLNGANSNGLKATVDVNFNNTNTEFKGYSPYNFNDKTKNFTSFEQSVFSGTTASDGTFEFNFNLEANPDNIPGMLNAVMTTKVFEGTGEFSIQYDTKKVSFYNSYVGHKIDNSSQYYLQCEKNYKINIANINSQGQRIASNKVKVGFYKVDYNWWYNSYNSNNYFDQSSIKEVVFEQEMDVKNGLIDVPLFVKKGKWGNYLIKVTDQNSKHSSSSFVYFETPYNEGVEVTRDASNIIQLSKDKDKYKVGENAKITMVSYFKGRAMLSIENSTEVLDTKWFDLEVGKNVLNFEIKETMSPNVYAYISAIQAHKNTSNNLPIRMYGIIPISVDNSTSILTPIISAPQKIEPESKLTFKVSESNNKPMTYTVAIVDEGLLGITGYKTPDPWKFFYGKQALGVLTWDVFDEVIDAFTGLFQEVFSIGGDAESLDQMNKAKSNRFESVVKYIGPFELKGGSNTHTIDIPNYVGNLKVMVVAGGKNYSFGNSTKDVQVAKPLMVLGTLPRVLSLSEEVELPVNVFVTDKAIKNVTINVLTDNKIELLDTKTKSLTFSNTQDQIINFKLKTKDLQGVSKVTIKATSGKYSSTYDIEVPIQIANPPTVVYDQIVLNPMETKTVQINPIGIQGTNSVIVETSSVPDLNIKSKIEELIAYPHGCLEQTTSALFPQLYLGDLTTLSTDEKNQINSNIEAGFEKYKSFQASQGGLSYWNNSNYVDDYATIYATHFMIEAKNKGYNINKDLLNNIINYLTTTSNSFNPLAQNYYRSTQAYRLYVLALNGNPNLGAMNRLKETPLDASSKIKLASAYALIGKKEIASQMISTIGNEIVPYIDDRYTYGSDNLDNAFLLDLYLNLNNKASAYTTFRQCVTTLNSKSYLGTQVTSGLIRSISNYLAKYKVAPIDLQMSFDGKPFNLKGSKPMYQQNLNPKTGVLTIKNNTNSITVVNIVRKGVELAVKQNISPLLGLSVSYTSKDGKTIASDKIARQTDFKQVIKITNNSSQEFFNMALSNYVPSGWEIINKRIAEGGTNGNSSMDYQDIRDDRILSYFSIKPGETKYIIQDFNASYEGTYTVPAIVVESMYNPSMKSVLGSYKTSVFK